jgi:hypothetical protein
MGDRARTAAVGAFPPYPSPLYGDKTRVTLSFAGGRARVTSHDMPDQSSAADEHALLQEITAPLATLPHDAVHVAAEADFPIAFRGYDRLAVDAYVKKTSQLVAELQSTRSPEAAVRRALERVGEQISGILQRAHETAEQITTQSRREAEDRLVVARQEAAQIASAGEQRVKDLDAETDRIWAERLRIVEDARELASQLLALADEAAARFPPAEDTTGEGTPDRASTALFDAEVVEEADEPAEPGVDDSEPAAAEDEGQPEDEAPTSVPPPPPAAAHPPPAHGSGPSPPSPPPPPVRDGLPRQAEPESEPDDPEATAILPPNRGRDAEPSDDEGEAPPTVIMPRPEEPPPTAEHPPPTAEHPPPTAEHPPPTAEHPSPTAEHPPPTAEHPVQPPSQAPPRAPEDPPRWSR